MTTAEETRRLLRQWSKEFADRDPCSATCCETIAIECCVFAEVKQLRVRLIYGDALMGEIATLDSAEWDGHTWIEFYADDAWHLFDPKEAAWLGSKRAWPYKLSPECAGRPFPPYLGYVPYDVCKSS